MNGERHISTKITDNTERYVWHPFDFSLFSPFGVHILASVPGYSNTITTQSFLQYLVYICDGYTKKLTQAELAEKLDISLSYLKDLERFRNSPSYEVFEKVIRYFNLSADTVVYPNQNLADDTYQKICRLLTRCDEGQLKVILATTEALLSVNEKPSEPE